MAFPTTGVLETFTGTLVAPPNAHWSSIGGISQNIQQDGAGFGRDNSATLAGSGYWNTSTFGRASECFVTIVTLPSTTNKRTTLYLLTANPGSASLRNGYLLEWTFVTGAGNDTWTLQRVDNNVKTQIGSTLTGNDLVAGDKAGFACDASGNFTAYSNTGGPWAALALTATDTTYTAAGNIGISTTDFSGGTQTFDDFGGGTTVASALLPPFRSYQQAVNTAAIY